MPDSRLKNAPGIRRVPSLAPLICDMIAFGSKETDLPNFHIYPVADGDSFWVKASSSEEARKLITLNVPDAANATESSQYRCEEDDQKSPPHG
ncbi:MAG: hypothetical protein CMF64_04810, partial [Magnetovibrio sp.]|nr:hypothetical protein [Magnetovibrio sp.]